MNGAGFLGIAAMGLLLLLGGTFLGFMGSDVEVDGGDMDGEGGDGPDTGTSAGVSLLSVAGLGSVLVGFGLGGYLGAALGSPVLFGVPLGLAGAYGCMVLTGRVRYILLRRLETGRAVKRSEFVAAVATVTVPIPPHGQGIGQVKLTIHGTPVYASARTEGAREIGYGERVVVLDQVDGICAVEVLELEA